MDARRAKEALEQAQEKRRAGDWKGAMELLLPLQTITTDWILQCDVAFMLADCFCGLRDFTAALPHAQRALALAREHAPRSREHAIMLNGLSSVQANLNNVLAARSAINEGLAIFNEQGFQEKHPEDYAKMLMELASLDCMDGHFNDQLASLSKAKSLLPQSKMDYVRCLNTMGACHSHMCQLSEALSCFQEAVEICRKLNAGKSNLYMAVVKRLAMTHVEKKQYGEAIQRYEELCFIHQRVHGEQHADFVEAVKELAHTRELAKNARSTPERRTCGSCGRAPDKMVMCDACCHVVYCNASCQLKDWEKHKRVCNVCLSCEKVQTGYAVMCCSRCMAANYCNDACQKAHWKTHRKECKPVENKGQ